MRAFGGFKQGWALAALALALPLAPASGQSVSDFQLRPGSESPTPRPAGPADPEAPIISAPRPAARPSPTPSAAPTATPSPAPSVAASPVESSPAAGARPQPRPGQPVLRQPSAVPQPGAPTTPAETPQTGSPDLFPTAMPTAPVPGASESVAPADSTQPALVASEGFDWAALLPWLGGALALLLAGLGGVMWQRRRENAEPVVEFERPVVPAEQPVAAEPAAAPEPDVGELVLGAELALPQVAEGPLTLSLSATRLSATLLNTTLQYRIELTNQADVAVGPLTVAGDMIAAHASLPVERQLGLDGVMLEKRHELASLAPGESATLSGEIRLPLAMITPIRAGAAAFFVPLARFRIEAARKGAETLKLVRTFVVGETPEQAGAALRPFRLDLGPRVYSRVGQREVAQPA